MWLIVWYVTHTTPAELTAGIFSAWHPLCFPDIFEAQSYVWRLRFSTGKLSRSSASWIIILKKWPGLDGFSHNPMHTSSNIKVICDISGIYAFLFFSLLHPEYHLPYFQTEDMEFISLLTLRRISWRMICRISFCVSQFTELCLLTNHACDVL